VRAVELLQHVAVLAEAAREVGALAGDLGLEEQRLARGGQLVGAGEVRLRAGEVAGLARAHAQQLGGLADRRAVAGPRRAVERARDRGLRARELALRDPQLGEVHVHGDARGHVAGEVAHLGRLGERPLGRVPLPAGGVQQPEVVEPVRHVARQAERAVFGEARLVVALRLLEVAADVGEHAEVLRRHRGELRVARPQGARAGLQEEPLGGVQAPGLPVHHGLQVQRVAGRGLVAPRLGDGQRRLDAVERGLGVGLHLERARHPAHQRRRVLARSPSSASRYSACSYAARAAPRRPWRSSACACAISSAAPCAPSRAPGGTMRRCGGRRVAAGTADIRARRGKCGAGRGGARRGGGRRTPPAGHPRYAARRRLSAGPAPPQRGRRA
jgi:hypothetical protein